MEEASPRPSIWRLGLGTLAVGVIAAAFAVGFRGTLAFVTRHLAGHTDVVAAMRALPTWARVVFPAIGAGLGSLVGRLARRDGGSVGSVMEAVVLGRVHLSIRATLLKSTASWLAIVSGGSLGREGPLIQFGGASGKLVSQRLALSERDTRTLIAAGTAAGFAAAYNTPFAAVLFVVEVVTGVIVLDAILPVLVATVLASTLTRAFVGQGPIYGQRTFVLVSPAELAAFAVLGVCAALAAQVFMRLLSAGEHAFDRPWLQAPLRPALGGAIAGLLVAVLPEVAGNGYEPLNALLDGKLAVGFVALLLGGKLVATTASVSSGSPGGVFTPTLLLGGALGFVYGSLVSAAGAHVGHAGGYALVGMAAATAATTHAPLMAAVMIFELSGDYAIALPLLLATALATFVSRALRRDSIYTAELRERGVVWEMTMEGRRIVS